MKVTTHMKDYTVVVWYPRGMRIYEVRAGGPVGAVSAAQQQDAADYPNDPADWNPRTAQFEVMQGHNLSVWRN